MALTVWSEQGEAKWRDCTQASVLMTLVYGGAKIPNVNTSAERERFEDAEGLPESQQEQGLVGYFLCDVASEKLYGVRAHAAAETELPALLATPGIAIALTGNGAGLPGVSGYPGGFQGNHSVCFVPIGAGKVNVYDPLAPMWYDPVTAQVSTILAWHQRLTYGQDIRYTRLDEFKEASVIDPKKATILGYADVAAGATAYKQATVGAAYYNPNPHPAAPNVPVYGQETRSDGAHGFWVGLQEGIAFVGADKVTLRPAGDTKHTVSLVVDGVAVSSTEV